MVSTCVQSALFALVRSCARIYIVLATLYGVMRLIAIFICYKKGTFYKQIIENYRCIYRPKPYCHWSLDRQKEYFKSGPIEKIY